MTTGERLVDISTLLTGTAIEHFLNISTGTTKVGSPCAILNEEMSFGLEINQSLSFSLEPIKTIELSISMKITQ